MRHLNKTMSQALALALVITLGIMVGTAQAAAQWPESWPGTEAGQKMAKSAAMVNERAFDFGEVEPESTVTHDFIVANNGQADLVIEQVSPG